MSEVGQSILSDSMSIPEVSHELEQRSKNGEASDEGIAATSTTTEFQPVSSVHDAATHDISKVSGDQDDSNMESAPRTPSKVLMVEKESAKPIPTDTTAAPPETKPLKKRRPRPPLKGILKTPVIQPTKFSFRRDILDPFNSRLSYTAYGSNGGVAGFGAGGDQTGEISVTKTAVGPAAVVGTAAAVAGGFWGSALKRLNAVSGGQLAPGMSTLSGPYSAPPAARDLDEDVPTHSGSSSISSMKIGHNSQSRDVPDKAGKLIPTGGLTVHSPRSDHSRSVNGEHNNASGGAPHTPSRGHPTSSIASASPYATVKPHALGPLPSPVQTAMLSMTDMKKVRFRMATLKVVYPINGPNGPLPPSEEALTKKRVNDEYRALRHKSLEQSGEFRGWTGDSLSKLYAECCRTREEPGIDRLRAVLREASSGAPPRVLDLSHENHSKGAIEALADLLSVDFGLKKLVLENCGLDDEMLKPLLHSLLVSGSLPTLSLANNKKIRSKGWKLISIFIFKARFLRYMDVSENNIDKKSAEHLAQAFTAHANALSFTGGNPTAPAPSVGGKDSTQNHKLSSSVNGQVVDGYTEGSEIPKVQELAATDSEEDSEAEPLFSVAPLLRYENATNAGMVLSIRLENCGLKGQALEALAHGIRSSTLKHISLRRNRITAIGAVSLAIMIRDYPLASDHTNNSADQDPDHVKTTPGVLAPQSFSAFESGNSVTARQSLQTPYVRRSPAVVPKEETQNFTKTEELLQSLDIAKESPQVLSPSQTAVSVAAQIERDSWQNSEARRKLRKQIQELPRTGSLLTLDIKNNDIRNGVVYIAQVLKRNRTLKVLNLSENKIDVSGLVTIAEALKFNNTLETLDMSHNPCCGPGMEGVTTLRAAITINSSLKRIFFNNTDLTSEGAIALAEFLPEATSLIHLDLTGNFDINIAGVLALSVSVKMNKMLRCLDLNIPANDPDSARLSQEILQCCVRNTEIAQEESIARGNKATIAAPILKSAVARDLQSRKAREERRSRREQDLLKSKDEMVAAAEECQTLLVELLAVDENLAAKGVVVTPSEIVRDCLVQAQLAEAQLAEAVAATRPGYQKDQALVIGERLSALLDRAKNLYDRELDHSPARRPSPSRKQSPTRAQAMVASQSMASPEPQTSTDARSETRTGRSSSPSTFSLGESDSEEERSTSLIEPDKSPFSRSEQGPSLPSLTTSYIESTTDDMFDPPSSPRSPMESQSRSLTVEEGEVFRKGVALGVEDEELGEVSGEELKKEILDAEVRRSPRPSLSGSESEPFGMTKPEVT